MDKVVGLLYFNNAAPGSKVQIGKGQFKRVPAGSSLQGPKAQLGIFKGQKAHLEMAHTSKSGNLKS